MPEKPTLVLGSGHLATQTVRRLQEMGESFKRVDSERFLERPNTSIEEESLGYAMGVLKKNGVGGDSISGICVVDREDRMNVRLLLAALSLDQSVPIVTSLSNENLAPHIDLRHPNVRTVNTARVATPRFIEAIETPATADHELLRKHHNGRFHGNRYWMGFPYFFVIFLSVLVLAGIELYHWSEGLPWLGSVYYKVTVMTGVSFGDTPIMNGTDAAKSLRLVDVLLSWLVMQVLMPALVVGWYVSRRIERYLHGRLRHRLRKHIIVAGLGKFGFHVISTLLEKRYRVIVIESDDRNPFIEALRARWGRKARILVGKANMAENLVDAGIKHARGLVAVVNDDDINLEIAGIARGLRPDIRVVLRLFDNTLSAAVRSQLGLQFTVSTSSVASENIIRNLLEARDDARLRALTQL